MSRARTLRRVAWALGLALASSPGCSGAATSSSHEHEEEHDHDHEPLPTVRLDPAAIERSGIEIGVLARAPLGGGVLVPAEVESDPSFTAHVSALVASRISTVEVRVGDRVSRGQRLATLASSDVGNTRASLAEARVRRDAARAARDRQAQLVEAGIGARRGLVEAEAQLAAIEAEMRGLSGSLSVIGGGRGATAHVTAPIDGLVVALHATVGEVVEPGATLFTILDPSHVWVVGHVPELDLAYAEVGATGTLAIPALPGRRWTGRVDFVAPTLDATTRTLDLRFRLDTPDASLRAGLFGRIALLTDDSSDAPLVVPRAALARIDGLDVVFLPDADDETIFHPVPVRLGRHDRGLHELLEGLDEGARYVTRGAFTLRSELARDQLAGHEH